MSFLHVLSLPGEMAVDVEKVHVHVHVRTLLCVHCMVCVCFCMRVRVCFWGEQAFGPYGVTTLLTYMPLTSPRPDRREQQAVRGYSQYPPQHSHTDAHVHTHEGFSSTHKSKLYIQALARYIISACAKDGSFKKGTKAITPKGQRHNHNR